MAKIKKVRYSGEAVFAGGIQIKRAQTMGCTTDIDKEEVTELANSGIVQYLETAPRISISLDTYCYGNTDNLAVIAALRMVASVTANTAAGSAVEPSRCGYWLQNIHAASSNSWTVNQDHLIDAYTPIVVNIRPDSESLVDRSYFVHNAALTGVNWSFDVGGVATENYTLEANNKTWCLGSWGAVRAIPIRAPQIGTFDSGGKFQHFWVYASVPACSVIAIGINEDLYRKNIGGITISDDLGAADYREQKLVTVGGLGTNPGLSSAGSTDKVILYVAGQSASSWAYVGVSDYGFKLTSTPGSFGGITKAYAKVHFFNTAGPEGEKTSTTAGKTLRAQTLGIDISMSSEDLEELGRYERYDVIRNTPIPVVVTLTANDTDLDMFARACATSDPSTSRKMLYTDLFSEYNALQVRLYKHKTSTAVANLLRTINVRRMTVNGEGQNVSIGGIASQEFTFQADNIEVIGSGYTV